MKLLDGSVDPGRPQYLVMEFVDGTNLAERINDGPAAARPRSLISLSNWPPHSTSCIRRGSCIAI